MVSDLNDLEELAALLRQRKQIDDEISKVIGRPAIPQHIGEFIASKIFNIKLEASAIAKGIDGIFADGPLKGKSANVKLYGKQEGILDITLERPADYYLVLTGPKAMLATSRGETRSINISHVYLFEMKELVKDLRDRGVKIGTATSVAKAYWEKAEVYPESANSKLKLTKEQNRLLSLFS
jgi:hypothetical protein